MLEDLKRGRAKHGLRRYLARRFKGKLNQIFFNSKLDDLVAAFRALGVTEGMTLCVHSSLSRLGYVDGGADTIIDALQQVVGESGIVMMPAFSMGGDMASYVRDLDAFDVRTTPSSVGIVPEMFRRRSDVLRSCHATNSVAAWGDGAAELLAAHEESITPFGFDTPYGRFAERDDAHVLMLDTHLHSLLHHLQERVNFPTLFLDETAEVCVIDEAGNRKTVQTRIMRPRVPYFVAVPSAAGSQPDWAILHDYALMFPTRRFAEIKPDGYTFDGFPTLVNRRNDLQSKGILTSRKLGRGEIGLLHVKPFLQLIQPELEGLIERYRQHYDPEKIAAKNLPYS